MPTKIEFGTFEIDSATRRAEELLSSGQTVVLSLKLKGREMAHAEKGFEAIRRILVALSAFGRVEAEPQLIGRYLSTTIESRRYTRNA